VIDADGHVIEGVAFAADFARVYKRWIADYCAQGGGRLFAAAVVPLGDVEAAIAILREARTLGLVCAVVPPALRDRNSMGGFLALLTASEDPGIHCAVSLAGANLGAFGRGIAADPTLRAAAVEAFGAGGGPLRGTSGAAAADELAANGERAGTWSAGRRPWRAAAPAGGRRGRHGHAARRPPRAARRRAACDGRQRAGGARAARGPRLLRPARRAVAAVLGFRDANCR